MIGLKNKKNLYEVLFGVNASIAIIVNLVILLKGGIFISDFADMQIIIFQNILLFILMVLLHFVTVLRGKVKIAIIIISIFYSCITYMSIIVLILYYILK